MRGVCWGTLLACAGLALLLRPPGAAAQRAGTEPDPELRAGYALWTEGRWAAAFDTLVAYRRSTPAAHNDFVDYLIATSACRSGRVDLGRELLASMPYYYGLDAERRGIVRAERDHCPPAAGAVPVRLSSSGVGPVSSGTRGKLFYAVQENQGRLPSGRSPAMAVGNLAVTTPPRLTREELATRLFPPDSAGAAAAVAAARKRLGDAYTVLSTGGFVLASRHHTAAQLRTIGESLDALRAFYMSEFGMPRPPWLVTVYLTGDEAELQALAARIHRLKLGPYAIGYSFVDDFSMAGVIPGTIHGTLRHELFHLMVRNDFADVPPWLDEGFAALYEVSRTRPGGRIEGVPNWRGPVLRMIGPATLSALLGADWSAFEGSNPDEDFKPAQLQATARYFALYLQERGKLAAVYRAMRERDALTESAPAAVRARIQRALGEPLDDAAFAAWLREAIRRPEPD